MPDLRDMSTPENRAHWDFVAKTAEEVRGWPAWKRGEKEPLTFDDIPGKPVEYPEVCRIGVEAARELAAYLETVEQACAAALQGVRASRRQLVQMRDAAAQFREIVQPVRLK